MAQRKILIIDDDPDITEAMKVVLENQGYQVNSVLDSNVAIDRLGREKPDLIILDVMMSSPREGFGFSRWLKHEAQYKDIPVLMLSAVKEHTGIDFKSAAGDDTWLPVDAFLDKPVKPDVLLEKVDELIKTR